MGTRGEDSVVVGTAAAGTAPEGGTLPRVANRNETTTPPESLAAEGVPDGVQLPRQDSNLRQTG
jgi:hypothetical protein